MEDLKNGARQIRNSGLLGISFKFDQMTSTTVDLFLSKLKPRYLSGGGKYLSFLFFSNTLGRGKGGKREKREPVLQKNITAFDDPALPIQPPGLEKVWTIFNVKRTLSLCRLESGGYPRGAVGRSPSVVRARAPQAHSSARVGAFFLS
jgi:hypothetical protein